MANRLLSTQAKIFSRSIRSSVELSVNKLIVYSSNTRPPTTIWPKSSFRAKLLLDYVVGAGVVRNSRLYTK